MSLIEIASEKQFDEIVGGINVTVVLFSAEWAEQCSQIKDIMIELKNQSHLKELKFLNVPAEELSEIALKYQIEAVPTVLFFRINVVIDRIDGVNIAALTSKCNALANAPADKNSSKVDSLEDRLKSLINQSKIMLFMKGDRNAPRCGFSKQTIAILNETGLEYQTFDILTDEEVRAGLKTYSDWPTYPQLYVKGELVGGLDIIKELLASGELIASLKAE